MGRKHGSAGQASTPKVVRPRTPDPRDILNREISWLAFNERVLEEAGDASNPLLERLKFLSIVDSNLDEFFMVRVAGIWRQIDAGITQAGQDGWTPRALLSAVSERMHLGEARIQALLEKDLLPALAEEGITLLKPEGLDESQAAFAGTYFDQTVLPLLTPLAVDPAHPFPRLANRSLVLMVSLKPLAATAREVLPVSRVGFLPVPIAVLPRFVQLPGRRGTWCFLALEDVIRMHLDRLFHGYQVLACSALRVTRDMDLPVDEDATDDLMMAVEEHLRSRRRGAVVRLQYEDSLGTALLELLIRELELAEEDLYPTTGRLALSDLFQVYGQVDLPRLKEPAMPPRPLPELEGAASVFEVIRRQDLLVHTPYQSFDDTVVRFLREAVEDPGVMAIKMTLYRMTRESPVAAALERAAERGKQVTAIVELRARFDEEANIAWARRLERAGVHVVYGLPAFKIHGKACLVVRMEDGGVVRYCHFSTGNYNEKTSRLYSDLGLFTARPEFGVDLSNLFNLLTGYTRPPGFHVLVPAPQAFRSWLMGRIERERTHAEEGKPARMILKCNALVDPAVIQALYEASQQGVKVDLLIRGSCCVRPGLPGLSEHIRVVSILDRFLEHARIYHFHNDGHPETVMASGDLMGRNLDRRVEIAVPVVDPRLAKEILDILQLQLLDGVKGRVLGPDGAVSGRGLPAGDLVLRSQVRLYEHYRRRERLLPEGWAEEVAKERPPAKGTKRRAKGREARPKARGRAG